MANISTIIINIEGSGFTFSDEYAVPDPTVARDAARRIAQYAMTQLGGSRRRTREDEPPAAAAE